MRLGWIAAFIAGLAAASPAAADVTARYAQSGNAPPMIVQISDNGDSRVTVTEAVYLTTGGATYMLLTDSDGQFAVRSDDFLSLLAEVMARGEPAGVPSATMLPVTDDGGAETVGGQAGRLFRISMPGNPADAVEMVISDDPALAALGRAVAGPLESFFAVMGQRDHPQLAAAIVALLHRGSLLRLGGEWRLESVETGPVPASQFALPSAPISRAALRARLDAHRPR